MTEIHTNIKIFDMSSNGSGVGTLSDEKRVFVQGGVWIGDTVSVRVLKEKKRYAIAELVEVEQPSKLRAKPLCRLHGFSSTSCGGCDWMHGSYESQLAMKESIVRFALRANRLETELKPIQQSTKAYHYRNRARLHFDGKGLGFYAAASKQLIDVEDCPVLTAKASRQLEVARQFLASEKTELNPEKNAEVFLDDSLDLSGADFLQPVGFRQANEEQNLFLKMTLGQYVRESGSSSVVELFAGTGNLTEQLSKEINSSGVTCVDLLTCAEGFKHKFPEIEFIGLDLYKGFSTLLDAAKKEKWSLLALDPPRAGWSDLAMFCEQVGTIERVAYISCNPNSFAKDAKALVDKGWKLESVLPVDMMPQTSQVELIAFLKREP